jgi:uncharacterized protein
VAKLLLLILVGVIAYKWWRSKQVSTRADQSSRPVENMVRCKQCGVYLPQSDACGNGSAWFCSAEHEREFHAKNKD